MKKTYRPLVFLVALVCTFFPASRVRAHPLGNFTINHFAGIMIGVESVEIDFVLDMAEIPAYQEIASLDSNRDGVPDQERLSRYVSDQCLLIQSSLALQIDGQILPLMLLRLHIDFPPGQGGLHTLRLNCVFQANYSRTGTIKWLEFEDRSYADRLGWREIVVNGNGVELSGEFAQESISGRLLSYPNDMLSSPLDQRQVRVQVLPLNTSPVSEQIGEGESAAQNSVLGNRANRNDAFTRLIQIETFTLPTLILALGIAFGWGAMHALTPGHGKTIVGAYLVGARGTPWHALYLGITTTITHTAGVIALGVLTLLATQFILPERLFPWLNFTSGLLVAGIGLNLSLTRWRAVRKSAIPASSQVIFITHTGHPDHEYGHGIVRPHDHAHPHKHNHASGPGGHTHLPPGADGTPVTWRSLLALGVSGGLLPCPSALVVMLAAIALNRVGLGFALVLAFSIGLASVLVLIGLAFIYTGRLFDRLPLKQGLLRFVPVASALFITLAGLVILVRAMMSLGLSIL